MSEQKHPDLGTTFFKYGYFSCFSLGFLSLKGTTWATSGGRDGSAPPPCKTVSKLTCAFLAYN